jgi:alkylhydroperoxidase family enzyme
VDQQHADLLRRLAINDADTLESVLRTSLLEDPDSGLLTTTRALVRLAALIAVHPSPASLHWAVSVALAVGATDVDIVDALVTVAPIVGLARINWAAPELATALDCNVGETGAE